VESGRERDVEVGEKILETLCNRTE
jgi:hypothetical protein